MLYHNRLGRTVLLVSLAWVTSACTFAPTLQGEGGDPAGPDAGNSADSAVTPDASAALARCQAAVDGMVFDWNGDPQGFTHGRMPRVASLGDFWHWEHWEHGQASSGPGSCRGDSSGCFATNLDDNYISCQRGFVASPPLDLSECGDVDVELVFHHWYDFWSGTHGDAQWFDGGLVEFSADGITWEPVDANGYNGTIAINPEIGSNRCVFKDEFHVHRRPGYVASSGDWKRASIAIPAKFRQAGFQLRFVYSSGVSYPTGNQNQAMRHTRPGWYIDDLTIALGSAAE